MSEITSRLSTALADRYKLERGTLATCRAGQHLTTVTTSKTVAEAGPAAAQTPPLGRPPDDETTTQLTESRLRAVAFTTAELSR